MKRSIFASIGPALALSGLFLVPGGLAASPQGRELSLGSLRASPGQSVSGFIDVAAPGGGTEIPVTLICGVKPGKVLGLVAGIHGSEYPPILALGRVRAALDPAAVSGGLILVHIANLPAFQRRLIYFGPADWKNLNRVFPGESGYLGRTDEEDIARNVRGIFSVLKLYRIMEGTPDMVQDPVWIDKYEVVSSSRNGLFQPLIGRGACVRAGQPVGRLSDYFGRLQEEVRAPFTGIILYIIGTPPANAGEPLFEVGRVKETERGRGPRERSLP